MITDAHLKMKLKFHNYMYIILSKFDGKSSKVYQVIFFSIPNGMPTMKALAKILFEISCTQDFQILFPKEHNSKRGHNSDMKKIMGQLFSHEESVNDISKPWHSPFKNIKFHRKVEKYSKFCNFFQNMR